VGDVELLEISETLLRVEHTDAWVPEWFTCRIDRSSLSGVVELEITYNQHERFVCRALCLIARDSEHEAGALSPADLREVALDELMFEAIERVAYRQVEIADLELRKLAQGLYRVYAEPDPAGTASTIEIGDSFRFPVAMFSEFNRAEYEASFGRVVREILHSADHSRRSPGGTRRAPSHLAVAGEYERARESGLRPQAEIAKAFNWSWGTAANAISAARKAGYIPKN
jgi:hypothetical protein